MSFVTNNIFFISSEVKKYSSSGLNHLPKDYQYSKDSKRDDFKYLKYPKLIVLYAAFEFISTTATAVPMNSKESTHRLKYCIIFLIYFEKPVP